MRRALVVVAWGLVVAGLGWWVVTVTALDGAPRAEASGYGQFVLAAVGLVIVVGDLVLRSLAPTPEPDVDELTDRLAVAVRVQWEQAAADRGLRQPAPLPIRWRRSREPVAGPPSAATASRSFAPLPGVERVTTAQLREGTHRTLHRVYGGLASGRLILAGGPGSGKSSAAVLLLLDALEHRRQVPAEQRARVPVPVLFTLHGWDPETTPVREWLAAKLTEIPVLSGRDGRRRAAELLGAGRIAVFLDGLDEIPGHHRPTALRALGDQALFRLVLLTRTAELVAAARDGVLTGAVALELRPLTPADAATYLRHGLPDPPAEPWRAVLEALHGNADVPVVRALDNPLAVTLLRDAHRPPGAGTVGELLDTTRFPTPGHVTHHLLDQAITTAYAPRPGEPPPRYTADVARHTLTLVALRLRHEGTRDFIWWNVPNWISRAHRARFTAGVNGLVGGVGGAILGGVTGVFSSGFPEGALAGFTFGSLGGLAGGFLFGRLDADSPVRLGGFARSRARWGWNLASGLLRGALFGLLVGLLFGPTSGVLLGLTFGLGSGLVGAVMRGFRFEDTSAVAHPSGSWRGDLVYWLVLGSLAGLVGVAGLGLVLGVDVGPALAPVLVLGLSASRAWVTAVSQLYLHVGLGTPLRLGRFLEDARARHLLRTVGPVYQFRHATLQDRLAETASKPGA
ncbi:hypothetical protein Q5530_15305 [Saccharothrix sp. BKS2]|uniref:hypothetical protein n=1 Tax=Saccharothrix sp. BKS2 TaxID=3064400 RepID=UPI0039EB5736